MEAAPDDPTERLREVAAAREERQRQWTDGEFSVAAYEAVDVLAERVPPPKRRSKGWREHIEAAVRDNTNAGDVRDAEGIAAAVEPTLRSTRKLIESVSGSFHDYERVMGVTKGMDHAIRVMGVTPGMSDAIRSIGVAKGMDDTVRTKGMDDTVRTKGMDDTVRTMGLANSARDTIRTLGLAAAPDTAWSKGLASGFQETIKSLRWTSGLEETMKSVSLAHGLDGALKSIRGTRSIDGTVKSLGLARGIDEALMPLRAAAGFDEALKSVRTANGLDSFARQMAVDLSDAVLDLTDDEASEAIEDEIGDGFTLGTDKLGNREWVLVVAMAEAIRQFALQQADVTDFQASLIMLAAIWLISAEWAREKK